MFELTAQPIDSAALQARLAAPEAGALTIFEGRVRNHHLGRPVTRLEYEAFDELAQKEGEAIVAETEQIYPGAKVLCVHRTGSLIIGEAAVWIGVASAHRQAGFAACRHVIEELKLRLPVWKKEHHPDGAAEWVNCSTEAAAQPAAGDYYSRQVALPEVGETGQAKLTAARVLIVGVGGLGCPAALYLAGAGVGRLTLVDGGKVERSNLHRQVLFTTAEIGAPKALAAVARLRLYNPAVQIAHHEGNLTLQNARTLVAGHDAVLDCTDNFTSRFALHDACRALGVPLVQAAVYRFEGELNVFQPKASGCLHCLWPAKRAEELDAAGNCAGGPVFGPAVGVLGVLQAAEVLKLLLAVPGADFGSTRLVNLLDSSLHSVERVARPDCPVCGKVPASVSPAVETDVTLSEDDFAALGSVQVLQLLGSGEKAGSFPGPAGATPVSIDDQAQIRKLAAAGPTVLVCSSGIRSAALARLLRAEGFAKVYALVRARR